MAEKEVFGNAETKRNRKQKKRKMEKKKMEIRGKWTK